jgi:hypothetical protein
MVIKAILRKIAKNETTGFYDAFDKRRREDVLKSYKKKKSNVQESLKNLLG